MKLGFHIRSPTKLLTKGLLMIVLCQLLLIPIVAFAGGGTNDDVYGMSYDTKLGTRTGWVPSNTQGLDVSYSVSTTGVSCTSSSGWIDATDTLLIAGGSPQDAVLQAWVELTCTGSGANQWNIQYGWYNNSGTWSSVKTIATLSTSTYSSLSGYIKIYYTGSCWDEVTYVSQVPQSYSIATGCYPSIQGTVASDSHDDWTNVETDTGQSGFSLSSSFTWGLSSPEFYVSSSWQTWNQHSGSWYAFRGYADVNPATNTNNIGTAFQSSPGVNIQVGQSASDGTENFWCISGSCPPRPPP